VHALLAGHLTGRDWLERARTLGVEGLRTLVPSDLTPT
jgi:hypothetical protein